MKKTILFSLFIFLSISVYPQKGIFYQATYLRSFYNPDTKVMPVDQSVADALQNLYPSSDLNTFVDSLNTNPFLSKMVKVKGTAGGGIFSFLSKAGGIDVTGASNAVASFLIKRAKEELTISFFMRFKKFSEANPEFKMMFPQTEANLINLLDYSYPQMLPSLQKSFQEDLTNVYGKIDQVMELPRYRNLLEALPEVRICLRSIKLVHQLETGLANPAEVLREFSLFPEWNDAASKPNVRNVGGSLAIANLISESIRKDTADQVPGVWVQASELRKLLDDNVLLNIYVALIYRKAQIDKIAFYRKDETKVYFSNVLLAGKDNLLIFRSTLSEFFDLTSEINGMIAAITVKKTDGQRLANEDYYNYVNSSIDFVSKANGLAKKYVDLEMEDDYFTIAKLSTEIYKDTYTRNYGQLFSDLIGTFQLILNQVEKSDKYQSLAAKSGKINYSGAETKVVERLVDVNNYQGFETEEAISQIIRDSQFSDEIKFAVARYRLVRLLDFLERLKPYGLFMANLVSAEKDGQAEKALESAVLPVGSSSIKKNTTGNLAVQAYLGAYLSNQASSMSSWKSKFGVVAPIGLAYTPGFLSWKSAGSISIFASLLDLGAIVDYKLKTDSTINSNGTTTAAVSKDYKIKLGQLFSPGAFLVYGFFENLPISLGLGGQYGPGLSKIDVNNTTVINNPSWRWSIFLSVDIPLLNLQNRLKK